MVDIRQSDITVWWTRAVCTIANFRFDIFRWVQALYGVRVSQHFVRFAVGQLRFRMIHFLRMNFLANKTAFACVDYTNERNIKSSLKQMMAIIISAISFHLYFHIAPFVQIS